MRLKKYLLIILSFAFAIAFVIGAPNATAKYYYSAEGEAFIISFPMMTVGQRNAVAYFLNILNQSNEALQKTLASVESSERWSGNDWADGDRFEDHDTAENENIEKLIALDAYYIVKFEPNEDPYKTFTMYSTPTASPDVENGMTTKVFKTTFAQDASGKYYDVASWEGEALGSEDYNTDFWAVKLETNQEYAVDLNLITDEDPGTNYDAQGPNFYPGSLSNWYDGYTFITFTPEETGSYAINVNDAESDAGKAYRLSALQIDGDKALSRTVLSNASSNSDVVNPTEVSNGVYSLNLTAGVKYYFRIQLPTPTTENGLTERTPYNVKIAITKSE